MGNITTTSFSNTPQATDDVYTSSVTGLTDDWLHTVILNVMANDLGGAAKSLYSLDSGSETTVSLEQQALLTQDTTRTEALSTDVSAHGAAIWITSDGKVGYDASKLDTSWLQNSFNTLGYAEDSFNYAIRLGNGTLSWATAEVYIAPPRPNVSLAHDTGVSGSDGITNDGSVKLSGIANGAAIQYSTDGGNTWTAAWSATEGNNHLLVRQVDVKGNISSSSSLNFTLDTTAPAETINSTIGTPGGATPSISSGGLTKASGLTLSGTVSDSDGHGLASVQIYDGNTLLGNATISGNTWQLTTSSLSDGAHSFTAVATDVAGNSKTSNPVTATVDTVGPSDSISSTIGTQGGLTPTISSGGLTKASSVTVSGTVADANGVASVAVFDGNTFLGNATINGNAWTFTTGVLADGTHSFTSAARDTAGNITTSAAVTATIDTTPPAAPVITTSVPANYNGASVDVNGTAEANSTVTLYNGTTVIGAVTADSSGHWSVPHVSLNSGASYNFTATAADSAGNTGQPSNALSFHDVSNYSVGASQNSATEGNSLTFTISRDGAPMAAGATDTVTYSINGQNHTAVFSGNELSKTVVVGTTDDGLYGTANGGTDHVQVTLVSASQGGTANGSAQSVVTDAESAPSFSVSTGTASATEGASLSFTVSRSSGAVAHGETVDWSANGQTGSLSFAPGDTSKTFTVGTQDDQVWGTHSPDVTAAISNPSDGAVLGTTTATTALIEADPAPSYSVSADTNSATEGSALTFTVSRTLAAGESVANPETVNWSANGQHGMVTFAPTDTSQTFTVVTTDDQVWGTHSPDVTASISNPTDGAVLKTADASTALTDADPPPSYSLSASSNSAVEGSALTFTVTRTLAAGESVANPETVNWSANGQHGTVTFAPTDTSQTFTVATTDDQVWGTHSPNVTATISNASDGAVLGTTNATTALIEADPPPSYSVSAGANSAAEGSALTFTVTRTLATGESVANPETVNWSANGQHGTVTFAPTDTSQTFTVATTDDQVWGTHSPDVTAAISNPSDGAVLGTTNATIALTEADPPPSYSLSASSNSAAEGSALTFTVTRTLATGESVANPETVNWSANGQHGTVTFAPTDTSQTFTVATTDDQVWGTHSPDVTAAISNPSDGAVLGTTTATTALTEADPPPSYSVSAGANSATEGSALTFTVTRTLATGESVANPETVNWSANGQHGTVTFAPTDTSQTFTVATTDDQVWGTHSPNVTATISNPSDGAVLGTTAATTALTEADPPPSYSVSAGANSATEGSALTFTVTRTLATGESVANPETVNWSANGQHGTVTFAPTDTSQTFTVATTDDQVWGTHSPDVTAAISNPSDGAVLGTTTATTALTEADPPPSYSVSAGANSATEGSALTFTVTRTLATGESVANPETVNWSANGQHGTVTFAPTDTSQTFTVATTDDQVWGTHSPDVTATISNPSDGAVLGTTTATTALTEADPPPSYSVSAGANSATEGSALTFTVTRTLATGESVANPETVNWSANGQHGTVTFAPTDTSQTFTVATTDDQVWGTHSLDVTAAISNPSDGAVLGTTTATTALTEADPPPSYSVSAGANSATEGSALTFTVTRTLATSESVANPETVNWSANGQHGTVTFAPTDTSQTFTVATTDDQVWGTHSPDVTAAISNPSDGAVLGTTNATTALTEADPPPSYSVSAGANSATEGSALTFTVTRTLATGESVANPETVNWSANGQHGTVTFSPTDTSQTFTVATTDDQVWGTHSPNVTATISNASDGAVLGTTNATTALTEADPPPSYSVSAGANSATEGSALTFTVTRTLATSESVANPETVNWSANGQHGTVTSLPSPPPLPDTSQTFTVATTDDQVWGTHSPNVTATISNASDGAVLGTTNATTALTEADPPPSYSVSAGANSATEGSALTFTVTRTLATSESVANPETVNWSANGQHGTVTFAPTDTSQTFTVATTDDQVWGTHSPDVTAAISNPSDGAVLGTTNATIALTEADPPPSYSLSASSNSAAEGSALTFTVTRTLATGESVANPETVNWSANGQHGTVTFAPTDTSQTFTVATTDDQVWGTHSPDVTATISNPSDGAVLGTASATTALTEADPAPTYAISANAASATEGSTLTFTVNRSTASGESIANPETVDWSANGQHGTVTFAPTDTNQTFTVVTTDDQVWGTHSPNVTAAISNPSDGAVLTTATANSALTEGDPAPSYSIAANASSATEGSTLTFTVNRSTANGESVANPETVNWSANGQTGTVTFAAGDASKTFTVNTTDDKVWGTHSPNVTATISNPSDGAVLGTTSATTALTEGDPAPTYAISANAASATEGSTLTFTVNRSTANGESIANPETVNWSANGQTGTLTFAPGDTSKSFTVTTTDDKAWGTHSPNVTATLSNPSDGAVLGTATATTALTEGDAAPSYSVSANAASATEGSTLTFTVNRSTASGESIANPETVNWSANGQHGTVTFAPTDTSQTFTVATTDDQVWGTHSPNVTATISNPSDGAVLGAASATTALTEGDPAPSYSIAANASSATEGSTLTFTVNRSTANGESIANPETVNWSANGQTGTVTFAAGDASKTFTVNTTDDKVWGTHSPNVTATISNPSDGAVLGTASATTALTEGDPAPAYAISANASTATEGSSLTFTVNRSVASGESVAHPETVNWSANGQSGTLNFAAGDTSKTFTVTTTDDKAWGTHSPNVIATLSNPSDGAVLGTASATTALTEGDPAPAYAISANASTATEGSSLTFTVNRSVASGESVAHPETVNWSANGQSGTVTFATGDTSKTFTVTTADNHVWGSHSADVTATISSPSDGALLGTSSATTHLTEGDQAPVFSLSGPLSASPGAVVTYTVARSLSSGESVLNSEAVQWSATGTVKNNTPSSGTLTFNPSDSSETFNVQLSNANGNNKSVTVTISNPTDGAVLGNATITTTQPAGIAGEPINLGLDALPTNGNLTSVTISQVPDGWTLVGGTHNLDGSWSIQTTDPGSLSIISPDHFSGAMDLSVSTTWTNSDGTFGQALTIDNVEAYAKGSPIFALSGDDHLTASSGNDLLVFSQPIGNDVVYKFDASADKVDLIGYGGFGSFVDVQAHLSSDANGNAVIAVGDGQSITLNGVQASSLTAANFVFDQTPVVNNATTMVIGDGAVMPLSGVINNSGTIEINAASGRSELELIEHGITLQGGGQITLSDSSLNVVCGTAQDVTLTNVDNTISGAGQLGAGQMTLINEGAIVATGTNALLIDTGPNLVFNSGTLESNSSGGLEIAGAVREHRHPLGGWREDHCGRGSDRHR